MIEPWNKCFCTIITNFIGPLEAVECHTHSVRYDMVLESCWQLSRVGPHQVTYDVVATPIWRTNDWAMKQMLWKALVQGLRVWWSLSDESNEYVLDVSLEKIICLHLQRWIDTQCLLLLHTTHQICQVLLLATASTRLGGVINVIYPLLSTSSPPEHQNEDKFSR